MSDRAMSGYYLILGLILIIVGYALSPHGLGGDWADTKALLASLGGNPGLASASALVTITGFVLYAAGLAGIRNAMDDGSGAKYIKLSVLFVIIGVAGLLVEAGLIAGAAGSAAAPGGRGMATAVAMITGAEGVGAMSASICSIGFALAGIAFLVQKNYHVIIGGLVALSGIFGAYAAATDYYNESNLMGIACITWFVLTILIGILTVRSKA